MKNTKDKEGWHTKLGTYIAIIALIITVWQIIPNKVKHLNGEWIMITEISDSKFSSYKGMTVQWKMFVCENGNVIKGTGEKIKINNVFLDAKDRTTLEFEGSIKDDKIAINYTEFGKLRKTSGIIIANLGHDQFSGTFSQSAADTTGKVEAKKITN